MAMRSFPQGIARLAAPLALALALSGCGGLGAVGPGSEWADLPRQSPDATEVLYLVSNQNCEFFVDGKSMIKGNRVRVLVTKGPHRVVCKPDGHRAKEEDVQPPFSPYHPIRFTFLIEDRLPSGGR